MLYLMNGRAAVPGCLVGMGILPNGGMVLDLACSLLAKCFYIKGQRSAWGSKGPVQCYPSLSFSGVTAALICPSLCTWLWPYGFRVEPEQVVALLWL